MRTSYLAAVPFFVVGTLVACGGSTTGVSPPTGTVAGIRLEVASELASLPGEACTQESDGGIDDCHPITGKMVEILLSNRAGTECANEFTLYPNVPGLALVMTNEAGLVAGTYSIAAAVAGSTTMTAGANFSTTTSTCRREPQFLASDGTITLTELTSTHVTGSYSVTFGADGALSGSFDASICDFPDASAPSSDAGLGVCQP